MLVKPGFSTALGHVFAAIVYLFIYFGGKERTSFQFVFFALTIFHCYTKMQLVYFLIFLIFCLLIRSLS